MSIIIGIDHGYYAIKTAHCSFPAGLTSYGEHEPYRDQLLPVSSRYTAVVLQGCLDAGISPQQIIFELGFVASETRQRQTRRNAHRTFGRQTALLDFFCNGCQRQQVVVVVRSLIPLDRLPPSTTNKKAPAKL